MWATRSTSLIQRLQRPLFMLMGVRSSTILLSIVILWSGQVCK